MTDEEIMALANAVTTAMHALETARVKFSLDTATYTTRYQEWDDGRAAITAAETALAEAKAQLDAALGNR